MAKKKIRAKTSAKKRRVTKQPKLHDDFGGLSELNIEDFQVYGSESIKKKSPS